MVDGKPYFVARDVAEGLRYANTTEAINRGFGAQFGWWTWGGRYSCLSGGALRQRHTEPGHPVEHRAADLSLGLLGGQSPGPKASTDDRLVAGHGGLRERAPAVADRLLPAQAPPVLDHPDVPVALAGRGVGGPGPHGARAGGEDHPPRGGGPAAVVGAVGGDRGDRAGDLIEQWADLRGIALFAGGQLGGEDLAAPGIDREMELAPRPPAAPAMPLHLPFARAVDLQAGGVDHDVDWPTRLSLRQRRGECQAGAAPGEGGVVGDADVHARQRLRRDPDGEAATPLKRPVVLRPVGHPVARPGDLVAARLVGLVGHRSSRRRGPTLYSRRRPRRRRRPRFVHH